MEEEPAATTEEADNSNAVAPSNRDLFGSDDDDDDEGEEEADLTTDPVDQSAVARPPAPVTADKDPSHVDQMIVEEEDELKEDTEEPNAPPTLSTQTLVVPEVTFPARDAEHHPILYTKLPNLVGVQTEAFHPDTYSMETEEEEFLQASYNLIRWRYKDPQPTNVEDDATTFAHHRESNTRLIEWDDGSYTLHIGKECFHVDFLDSSNRPVVSDATNNNTFAGLNGYLYLSQNAAYTDTSADTEVPPTPAGTVLECMGMVQQRLVIRPSSLQSEAHKSLTVGIRQKTMGKVARIAQVVTQEDPELQKQQRIKVSSDLEKAAQRKRAAGYYPTGARTSAPRSRPRMSRDYLEEDDDDYDTTRLKDMKRRVMGKNRDGDDDMDDYGDDDDDEEDDEEDTTFRKVRNPRAKSAPAAKAKEDSDDDVFVDDDDDEEEDAPAAHLTTKKRSHQAVIDDDDESE
jgi:RNA polymerase-associated protein LEO1